MTSGAWNGRKVFVTGPTGMVGSWLVKELLARDSHVVALVKDSDPNSELFRSGDIDKVAVVNGVLEDFWTLERAINEHEIDTVFHLGAQTIVGTAQRSPLPTFESNIRGTYNLLEACRNHTDLVERVVIASSDKAYGDSEQLPYTEDMPLNGRNPYDVSKSCADLISLTYAHSYQLPLSVVRCGNVYGGGDLNWSRIVPGTIRSCLRGERPPIRSDGSYVRDYIYVRDVASAYIHVAENIDDGRVQGEAFNVSDESPLSVLDMVHEVQRLMGAEHLEPLILDSADGEIRSQYLSAAKVRSMTGWSPRYALEEGLSETIQWYREFLS